MLMFLDILHETMAAGALVIFLATQRCQLMQLRATGEKLLVFSQSLETLDLLEAQLAKEPGGDWKKNRSFFRLDGSTSAQERQVQVTAFNDPANSKMKLFLLSTKAGSLGINLVAACRVVIMDVSWNPCHDAQVW
jgi:RAD54-like protein 2